MVLLADGMIDLRLGRWQEVLADVETCDSIVADPPYSARTHEGQRTGSSIRMPTIGYSGITETDARWLSVEWCNRATSWAIVFCDHTAFRWHEQAWEDRNWLTFAPVFLKSNPTPRFSGDGPAFALEFMLVARQRDGTIKPGSLPAYYEHLIGGCADGNTGRTVAGAKPLPLMQAIIHDYTRPGDLVVDPFCGGGTTALACAIEGRRCITSEMDPVTFEKAKKRLERGFTPSMFQRGPRVKAKQGSLV